jgi:hypothetical protein
MTTTMGINERVKRYRLAERCAEFTPQVIALWKQIVEDKNLPYVLRLMAADRLMDRGLGRAQERVLRETLRSCRENVTFSGRFGGRRRFLAD